jgi:phosphopantetheinyl transferase
VPPRDVRFTTECTWCGHPTHGKKRLLGNQGGVNFSTSSNHARAVDDLRMVVAVAGKPIGVDIVKPEDLHGVDPEIYMSEREVRDSRHAADRSLHEATVWAAKEAYGKLVGLGLALEPRGMAVERAAGGRLIVRSLEDDSLPVGSVRVAPDSSALVAVARGDTDRRTVAR